MDRSERWLMRARVELLATNFAGLEVPGWGLHRRKSLEERIGSHLCQVNTEKTANSIARSARFSKSCREVAARTPGARTRRPRSSQKTWRSEARRHERAARGENEKFTFTSGRQ